MGKQNKAPRPYTPPYRFGRRRTTQEAKAAAELAQDQDRQARFTGEILRLAFLWDRGVAEYEDFFTTTITKKLANPGRSYIRAWQKQHDELRRKTNQLETALRGAIAGARGLLR